MATTVLTVRERLDNARGRLPEQRRAPDAAHQRPGRAPDRGAGADRPRRPPLGRRTAEEVHARRLEQLDGVASVAVVGAPKDEIRVEVDPARHARARPHARRRRHAPSRPPTRPRRAAPSAGGSSASRCGRSPSSARPTRSRHARRPAGSAASGCATSPRSPLATADPRTLTRLDGAPAVGLVVYKDAGSNTVAVTRGSTASIGAARDGVPRHRDDGGGRAGRFVTDALSNLGQEIVARRRPLAAGDPALPARLAHVAGHRADGAALGAGGARRCCSCST